MTVDLARAALDRADQLLVLQSALLFCTVIVGGGILVKALVTVKDLKFVLTTVKVKCLIVDKFRCNGPQHGRNLDGGSHQP